MHFVAPKNKMPFLVSSEKKHLLIGLEVSELVIKKSVFKANNVEICQGNTFSRAIQVA